MFHTYPTRKRSSDISGKLLYLLQHKISKIYTEFTRSISIVRTWTGFILNDGIDKKKYNSWYFQYVHELRRRFLHTEDRDDERHRPKKGPDVESPKRQRLTSQPQFRSIDKTTTNAPPERTGDQRRLSWSSERPTKRSVTEWLD